MNIQEIIIKKRDKKILTSEEIKYFIEKYVKGDIADYQAAALVMAMFLNGMTKEEIKDLTMQMAYSGEVLDLSVLGKTVVDKHSTGGVGDKITMILMPIIASLGIPVAKMSGRGLGFTGGTTDKLESIPGYKTQIPIEEFIENVKKVGISLIGSTANLAPADKKLYALRDVIGCVESMPLIASSIMSKKIAAGADKILLDVTVGSGAFMKTQKNAEELATIMKEIGSLVGKETVCVLTNMDEPVGRAVGNTLEVVETVQVLKGNIPEDIQEIILELGSQMIRLSGKNENLEENKKMILENIKNGKAYQKFLELVKNQGGDITYIENTEKFEKARYIMSVIAEKSGYVAKLNAEKVGHASVLLGAGRMKKEDEIDKKVGFVFEKKVGSKVEKGEVLARVYGNDGDKTKIAVKSINDAYTIQENEVEKQKYILGII